MLVWHTPTFFFLNAEREPAFTNAADKPRYTKFLWPSAQFRHSDSKIPSAMQQRERTSFSLEIPLPCQIKCVLAQDFNSRLALYIPTPSIYIILTAAINPKIGARASAHFECQISQGKHIGSFIKFRIKENDDACARRERERERERKGRGDFASSATSQMKRGRESDRGGMKDGVLGRARRNAFW